MPSGLCSILKDEDALQKLEDAYLSTFGDGQTLLEFTQEEIEEPQNWIDQSGDLGVEEFKKLNEKELRCALGIPLGDQDFPYLNRWRHVDGLLPSQISNFSKLNEDRTLTLQQALVKHQLLPIKPFWHQLVGAAAAIKRMFNEANVLYADGVGVGKTMQAFLLMCLLRYYKKQFEKENGKQCFCTVSSTYSHTC